MLRMIREVEPAKPSTKLSGSAELPSIAAKRKLEPAKLARLLRGDLDWIVMKCLEKERGRRYETANGLAMDVQRYLADEAVLASPPSTRYRLRKFMRRHRGPVLAASIIAVLLLGGIVGTSVGFLRADRLRQVAENREQEALDEKAKAEASQQQAMDALKATTDDVIEQLLSSKPTLGPTEKAFLQATLKRWQTFAAEQGDSEHARAIRAEGTYRVAHLRSKLGQNDEARTGYEEAIILFQELTADFPDVPRYRRDLASNHNDAGLVLRDLGMRSEAEMAFRRALAIQEKLTADFPTVPQYRRDLATNHNNVGLVLRDLGKGPEAETAYRRALAIYEKLAADLPAVPTYRLDLARSHYNLGNLLRDLGKRSKAEAAYGQALAIQEKLTADFPAVPQYRVELARSHNSLGVLLVELGKRRDAETAYRRASAIQENLTADFPAVPQYREDLAGSHNNMGILFRDLGKPLEAEAAFRRGMAIREKLAADFPAVPQHRLDLARSHNSLGVLLAELGKRREAETAFRQALAIQEKLAADYPGVPMYREDLARSHSNVASLLAGAGKPLEAEAACRHGIGIQEKLSADFPAVPKYRQDLATSHNNLGVLLAGQGKLREAEAALRQALSVQEKLAADFPTVPEHRRELGRGQVHLGNLQQSNEQPEEALKWYARSIETLEELLRQMNVDAATRQILRNAHMGRAQVLDNLKRYAEAAKDWDKALELSPERERPAVRMNRARSRARGARVDAALAEAEELAKNADANTLYYAACVFALAASERDGRSSAKEDRAGRAVVLLRQAVAKGYKDAEHMKQDDDLNALRQRDDFKKLLAELEKRPP
jgi:tetratricopeptide (TPR) repeat protein